MPTLHSASSTGSLGSHVATYGRCKFLLTNRDAPELSLDCAVVEPQPCALDEADAPYWLRPPREYDERIGV